MVLGGENYYMPMSDGKFYKGLLVLSLYEGVLDGVSGHVVFSDVLEVNDDVNEFDRNFPYKEKKF